MRLLVFALLFSSPLPAAITERYVSSSGTDTYANSTNPATPMSFATAVANYAANDCIHVKADGTYPNTSGYTFATNGPSYWRGYTTTPGDGGRPVFDGGTTGASFDFFTLSGTNHVFQDFIFQNNGATGTAAGINCIGGHENCFIRCSFSGFRGMGAWSSNRLVAFIECEAVDCNKSNTSGFPAGIGANLSGSVVVRCHSHDHTAGIHAHGFESDGSVLFWRSIAESNTGNGLYSTADTTLNVMYCDFWGNGRNGIISHNSTDMLITVLGCNLIGNGRYGVEFNSPTTWIGAFQTNGLVGNSLGDISSAMEGMDRSSTVTYPSGVTPWYAPASGDFRITSDYAKGKARGVFPLATSFTGTVSFSDIGAAQHRP